MNTDKILQQLHSGRMSRRRAMKGLGALGLATATIPMISRPARAATEEATYFTWGGYDDDTFFPSYVDKHGTLPNYATFGDAQEAFTKLTAGFVADVIHPCSADVPRWKESGMFQPFDPDRLPSLASVYSKLQGLPGTSDSAGRWFVPIEWGATSITYRTDLVDVSGGESWEMLLDPKYKGRVAAIDSPDDTWWCMAVLAGVDISKELTPADIETVKPYMERLKDNVRMFTNDMTSLDQALASGEVVMAMSWNETPVRLLWEGHPVKFAAPKEGSLTWVCGHMLHAEAPYLDKAYDITNAMLTPETGVYIIEEWGYGHSNADSFRYASEESVAMLGLDKGVAGYLDSGKFGKPQSDEMYININRSFEAIKTGF